MPEAAPVRRILQFGAFEVDLQQRELRKDGFKVKLRDQSFVLLEALLERSGEVVSRDELRNRLWPADIFVDFDHGLNAAMKRLRDALGDDPDNPRFIETVPKRGYRFLAPVNGTPLVAGRTLVATAPPATVVVRRHRPWQTITACVSAGLLCLIIVLYLHRQENTAAPAKELAQLKVTPFTTLLGMERSPTFSPDGSQIAFAWKDNTIDDGTERKFDIYVKVTGNENLVRLTSHPADSISLSWSPDGAQIAFQRLAGSDSGVYLVPALGGAERRLRATNAKPFGLSWSPDGRWIAFADSPLVGGGHTLNLISVVSLEVK
jgi:DNA-binding winged helix-turn-helix (wHTH) protein/dipeptidyl aminopeptidase/acylaminoacyl peptidase